MCPEDERGRSNLRACNQTPETRENGEVSTKSLCKSSPWKAPQRVWPREAASSLPFRLTRSRPGPSDFPGRLPPLEFHEYFTVQVLRPSEHIQTSPVLPPQTTDSQPEVCRPGDIRQGLLETFLGVTTEEGVPLVSSGQQTRMLGSILQHAQHSPPHPKHYPAHNVNRGPG